MKKRNIFKIVFSVALSIISIIGYSSLFGNPISYLKARSEINSYIEEKYNHSLVTDEMFYSSKTNGYSAIVNHENDSRYSSYIEYYNTGYISDGYQFEVRMKMEEEVKDILESLINQSTNLTRDDIGVEPSIELEEFKYKLNDKYSGEEPINLQIRLHPPISYTEKYNPNKEVALYKNSEDFAKDVYDIVKILEVTNYKFNSVEIYSYREDGNSNYRYKSNMKEEVKSVNDVIDNVYIADGEKEKYNAIN